MSLNKNKNFIFFLFIFFKMVAQQEIQNDSLKEVIVTATRTQRKLGSLPLPVTLVSRETIDASGSLRVNEILEEQTGIVTVPDQSGFEGIQIQGLQSEYILILIDGVPLLRGQTAGNFDLKQLAIGNIKQIEVVKGASSSLYGSDALGGVINIITDTANSLTPSGFVSYRNGTFNEQDINLSIGQKLGKANFTIYGNRFSSNGFDLTSDTEDQTVTPFENHTFGAKVGYKFSNKLSLVNSVRTFNEFQDYEVFFNESKFKGKSHINNWLAHSLIKHQWNTRFNTEYELYYTQYKAKQQIKADTVTEDLFNSNFINNLFRPELRTHYQFAKKGVLTTGTGFSIDYLDRDNFSESKKFNSQYVYAQADISFFNRLNVIVGARQDWHSEYNKRLSPKASFLVKVNEHFDLKGSIGSGFKAPAFRQLFLDFTNSSVGYTVLGRNVAFNRLNILDDTGQILSRLIDDALLQDELKAETSISYNAGFSFKSAFVSADVSYFRNTIKNLIDTFQIARKTNGQNVFSYQNFAEVYTTGIECNAIFKPIKNIQLSMGYQLLYAFDKQIQKNLESTGGIPTRITKPGQSQLDATTIKIGKDDYLGLPNRSKHNINIKLFYNWQKIKTDFNIRTVYRSTYGVFDTNANGILDTYDKKEGFIKGFAITNLAASKNILKNWKLQIGANNVFNYKGEQIANIVGRRIFGKLYYNF